MEKQLGDSENISHFAAKYMPWDSRHLTAVKPVALVSEKYQSKCYFGLIDGLVQRGDHTLPRQGKSKE